MKTLRGIFAPFALVFLGVCILSSSQVAYADSFSRGFKAETSLLFFGNAEVGSLENLTTKTVGVDSTRLTFMPRISVIDAEGMSVGGTTMFSLPNKGISNNAGSVVALAERSSTVLFFTDGRIPGANYVLAAPEPATLILLGSGLAGVAARSIRRRQRINVSRDLRTR